jgi:Fur family ferric uptake transcriptional regulator
MKTPNHSQANILKVLEQTKKPLSAQEIWAEIQKQGQKIGVATVYRNLESLKIKGLIQIRTVHNQAIYSLVSEKQNFATCLQCGEQTPLGISLAQSVEAPTLQSQAFEVYYHTLEVFGLCSPCQERSP